MTLVDYIIMVAILGGALSVVIWLMRKTIFWTLPKSKDENLPRILRAGEPVPYGLAISAAFLYLLYSNQIPGIATKLAI